VWNVWEMGGRKKRFSHKFSVESSQNEKKIWRKNGYWNGPLSRTTEISAYRMKCLSAGHTVPHKGKFIHRLSNYQLLIILPRGVNYQLNSFRWTLLPVVFPSPLTPRLQRLVDHITVWRQCAEDGDRLFEVRSLHFTAMVRAAMLQTPDPQDKYFHIPGA
jgi:hypothetical protein